MEDTVVLSLTVAYPSCQVSLNSETALLCCYYDAHTLRLKDMTQATFRRVRPPVSQLSVRMTHESNLIGPAFDTGEFYEKISEGFQLSFRSDNCNDLFT